MDLDGFRVGDEVELPDGTPTVGVPARAVILLDSGAGLFVEQVEEADMTEFLGRPIKGGARVLPVVVDGKGIRDISLAAAVERVREEEIVGFPEPRITGWCLRHLASEGRNLEVHFEHFRGLCNLQLNQWGMEEYGSIVGVLKALLQQDQLDVTNIIGAELLFRRLQVIEYCYSDRLKDKLASSTGGKLSWEEQAAFGAAARTESRLMICPKLIEEARKETEKEAGLAKALGKAREARAALSKKS